jgi:hypothetical protein
MILSRKLWHQKSAIWLPANKQGDGEVGEEEEQNNNANFLV